MNGTTMAFRRTLFVLAVPLNVLVAVWVVAGNNLWAPTDPSAANMLRFVVGPILAGGLTGTTILMFAQRRQPRLTTAQAWLQVMLWIALSVFGLTFPALAEDSGGASILLRLIDQTPLTSALSGLLWTASTFAAWGLGIALFTVLILGIDPKRQRVSLWPPSPLMPATPPPSTDEQLRWSQ